MKNIKNIIGNIFAGLYLVGPMLIASISLLIMPIMFLHMIGEIRSSGFAAYNINKSFVGIVGIMVGPSLIIPPLRKIYKVFPWLYTFIMILFLDTVIFAIGVDIYNKAFDVIGQGNENLFFILMIVVVILCRAAIGIFFNKRAIRKIE